MRTTTEESDEFTSVSTKNSKRIYIGNLRYNSNLKERLIDFLKNHSVDAQSIDIQKKGNSCFALVSCPNVNAAIAALHQTNLDGRTLIVQRERKNQQSKSNSSRPFGSGWSKPTPTETKKENDTQETDAAKQSVQGDVDIWDVSEHVASVVASEIEAAEKDPSNGDALNTVIASTAAVSLLSSMNAFGLDRSETTSPQQTNPALDDALDQNATDVSSMSKKPLSALLADYGEQDVDFKVVSKPVVPKPLDAPKKSRSDYKNRLTLQGKAPIHVQVTSFGYIHGAPPELKSGWSHAHPLPPVDCRDLSQVPHYMARQNGLSPAVKRALLNNDGGAVRTCANQMGKDMLQAVQEAIVSGGHGPASPLLMKVHVGSDLGRHRSVLVCELAATALRKLLRSNEDNRITQPVSVGTRHVDIERRQRDVKKELERDW